MKHFKSQSAGSPGGAFLLAILLIANNGVAQPASGVESAKQAALRNVVKDAIAPAYAELSEKCTLLRAAAETATATNEASADLAAARKAWTEALLAARRVQYVQSGPMADREYLSSFYYSKVLGERIDGILSSTRAIDEAYVQEFGPNARGMFALEYLLCSPGTEREAPATAVRRKQYVLVLARDLERKAGELAADWAAAGDQSAGDKFVKQGQQGLSLKVNEIAQLLEQVAEQRINFVLQLPLPISRQKERIEGSRSGTSGESVVAMLDGLQRVYRGKEGNGLESYVRHLNAPLADRVKGQFEATLGAARAVGGPLEQARVDEKSQSLQTAYEKARALEVIFKVDVASTLGVTLTFSSNDGD